MTGSANAICNNESCYFDFGDCANTDPDVAGEECNTGCVLDYVGNGDCNPECNIESCEFDKDDCEGKINEWGANRMR